MSRNRLAELRIGDGPRGEIEWPNHSRDRRHRILRTAGNPSRFGEDRTSPGQPAPTAESKCRVSTAELSTDGASLAATKRLAGGKQVEIGEKSKTSKSTQLPQTEQPIDFASVCSVPDRYGPRTRFAGIKRSPSSYHPRAWL